MHRTSSAGRWWLAALCCVVYATMWIGWESGWSWVAAGDAWTLAVGRRMGLEHHGWVTFWHVWCTVFSPVLIRVATLLLIGYAIGRRQIRLAVFLFVGIELSALLTVVAKGLADRPRPTTAMVDALSTSFPSGHAVGTMVAVLALGVVLRPHVRRALWPWWVAAGAVVVVSVGAGRVALNVHQLSDVVAGWALGYAYFAVCLLILRSEPAGVTAAAETPEAPDTAR